MSTTQTTSRPRRVAPPAWLKVQRFDMRRILRWLVERRWLVFWLWVAVGALITWPVFALLWNLGATPEVPETINRGLFGQVERVPGTPATPGLGPWLMSQWWGVLLLLVVVPLFVIQAPALLLALAVVPLTALMWVVFGPLAFVVTMVSLPLLVLIGGPKKLASKVIETVTAADRARGLVGRFQSLLGLGNGPRRSTDGDILPMQEDDFTRLQEKQAKRKGEAVLLGYMYGRPFWYTTEKHIHMVMPTGSGKNRDLIGPNLLAYHGSIFCLDPKGESARFTAAKRQTFGAVKVLDPFGISGLPRARFNPLRGVYGPSVATMCQMLAASMMPADSEDYFRSAGQQLLAGVIGHVMTEPSIMRRDLVSVRELLMNDIQGTLKAMAENMAAPGMVRNIGASSLEIAPEEWSGVISACRTETRWLEDPAMADVVSDGGEQLEFGDYLTSVLSVYVCLPAPYFTSFSRWLRLVTSCALETMMREPVPLPHRVRFVLDEMSSLGYLKEVETALTLARGYNVQLWSCWQHLADVERCYPKAGIHGWDSSSGVRLITAADNMTAEHYSKLAGMKWLTAAELRLIPETQYLALIDHECPAFVWRSPGPQREEGNG